MHAIELIIEQNVLIAWAVLAAAFFVLSRCADVFVDAAVGLAARLKVPKLVIGIVLVSLATTAPELSVSLMSALKGNPEMALGNAIGSVICDDGLALALAGICAVAPISVIPRVLHTAGPFLIFIQGLLFLFIWHNQTLDRWEGGVLVLLFVGYILLLVRQHKKGLFSGDLDEISDLARMSLLKILLLFALALGGIIFASEFIIVSATTIARSFGVPEAVIALTLVALGTSIPEVATCISAARKGEGAIAVGNILGADIMNICWVAGASALANNLMLSKRELYFMFPWMFVIVGTMLLLLRKGYTLTRRKGVVLLGFYMLYVVSFFFVFAAR